MAYTPRQRPGGVADVHGVIKMGITTDPGKLMDEATSVHTDALYPKGTVGSEEYEFDLST